MADRINPDTSGESNLAEKVEALAQRVELLEHEIESMQAMQDILAGRTRSVPHAAD